MDPITGIALLILTGIAVGFAGGLLGVGGCFIMTPVQIWVFTSLGVPLDIAVKQAFGTNLLVILPTAMSSAWGHSKRDVVLWRAGVTLGVVGAVGAVIGATIAAQLPGAMLKTLFGVAIMGFLSALIVGPCVAPPLAGAQDPSGYQTPAT